MKYVAVFPDPVTGRLVPYCGVAGIAIEFNAKDQADANRLARLNRLPPAVMLMPAEMQEGL